MHNPKGSNDEIFGRKYANVIKTDKQLQGAVNYLISGHGEPGSGAIGKREPTSLGAMAIRRLHDGF